MKAIWQYSVECLQFVEIIDNMEGMEKPFDHELTRMSKNQLLVLRYLLSRPDTIMTNKEIAKRTGVVEKQLGGVLSAMSRKRLLSMSLIEPMGRDTLSGLRWKLNSKAITVSLAEKLVGVLIKSYK